MRAIEILAPGGPENLNICERPIPVPSAMEILIKVGAAGVNRPDILQRLGKYAPPPGTTDIPGLEVAGVVESMGKDVSGWQKGDRVMALLAGGGYAEYALAPALQCLPIPSPWRDEIAASFPETFFTVWTNVFERGGLKSGQSLLIHGGGSGIGTAAIQLAHHFGAQVFVTAGSEEKCEKCRILGADIAINYRKEDFVDILMKQTDGKGVNVILDMIGGNYIERNLRLLAIEGRLVQIAFQEGSIATINFAPMMVKRQWITGSTLRPRSPEEKGAIAQALKTHIYPALENNKIKPVLDRVFPLEKVADAHRYMEKGAHFGNIVLKVTSSQ